WKLERGIAQAALRHQLLDVGNFDRYESRHVHISRLGDQQHVLEPESEMFVGNPHLRLDGENLAGLKSRAGIGCVVNRHSDSMTEGAYRLPAVEIDERICRVLD